MRAQIWTSWLNEWYNDIFHSNRRALTLLKIKRNLFEEAYERYQANGIEAVFAFAEEENIKDWRLCPACDCEVPCVEDTCLVCDQPLD